MDGGVAVQEITVVGHEDRLAGWIVYWSAVCVGALAAVALALIIGLVGTALGAHQLAPGRGIADWKDFGFWALVFSVFGAFLSFAVGGWIAGRISGFRQAEPAMLHGAILWLVAVPMLLVLGSLGSTTLFGAWYAGLAGAPAWVRPPEVPIDPNAAAAARNAALGAVAALLLGLTGGVIGGWMASGEPMTISYYRTRGRGMARASAR